ncbi:MAG: multicopper oxidase [Armatimonadota bacterium]|nr:multicopper oxidase [Armatimonadota bacterium]
MPGMSRSRFLVPALMIGWLIAAGLTGGLREEAQAAQLDPATIQKYTTPLVIPPAMPRTGTIMVNKKPIDYYEIAVRQFQQQILPAPLPDTTVWSYGSVNHPGTFNYPAFTIEAKVDKPVRVKWINDLVDSSGNYLPHILPVDQTLHWANPPGGDAGKDMRGSDPTPYTGPVPIVTHLHGSHVTPESDGFPEAWYLPNANNIPAGYATRGTHYNQYDTTNTQPGTAVFQYRNDQRATTLWYHDHTLGMTRANVYAGPAGFYLLRGGTSDTSAGILPGPAPKLGDKPGKKYYEIPIVVQDRSFNDDGSLFYPADRAFFEGLSPSQLQIPFIPETACDGLPSDVSPIHNPEFFGNTIVVNGNTWPTLNVEPRRYRFRFLNGCNSRFLILKMVSNPLVDRPVAAALPFWQMGTEGGFLPTPVGLDQLLIGLAERADVVVDFTGLPVGTEVFLINEAPDEPFGGGEVGVDFPAANPATTGQVMRFVVTSLTSRDLSAPPSQLRLPRFTPLGPAVNTRQVTLNELESQSVFVKQFGDNLVLHCSNGVPFGPIGAFLGTFNPDGSPNPLRWEEAITETPKLGDTEIWEIHNFTEDGHPVHIHLVQFQVVDRTPMGFTPGSMDSRPPESWETGYKDTVIALPGEITRVKAKFDIPGLFVWHCHILEHEDNEMMRPYEVVP